MGPAFSRCKLEIPRPTILAILACTFLGLGADSAHATLSLITSESTFLSSASIVSTETFDEFSFTTHFTTPQVVIDGVVYSTDQCDLAVFGACWGVTTPGVNSPRRFGPNAIAPPGTIGHTVLSFGEDHFANAFGFYFVGGGTVNGVPVGEYEMSIDEVNGDTSLLHIGPIEPSILYFGFLSSVGIRDISFQTLGEIGRFNLAFDNVSHSRVESSAAAVPEPSTLLLLSPAGLFVLSGQSRRRARARRCPP